MIENRTVIDQLEMLPNGDCQTRFAKQTLRDGVVVRERWHRYVISADADVDAAVAVLNDNLEMNGDARCPDWSVIKQAKSAHADSGEAEKVLRVNLRKRIAGTCWTDPETGVDMQNTYTLDSRDGLLAECPKAGAFAAIAFPPDVAAAHDAEVERKKAEEAEREEQKKAAAEAAQREAQDALRQAIDQAVDKRMKEMGL